MPTPNWMGLWPFLKDLFLNKQSLALYIKRNKLSTFFMFSTVVIFLLLLFITEQAVQYHDKVKLLQIELTAKEDYRDLYDECTNDLIKAKLGAVAMACPTPTHPPKDKKDPAPPIIVPRQYDDSLRKKLDTIRW